LKEVGLDLGEKLNALQKVT